MSEKAKCDCCAAPSLIFPCSGSSDVGELTDRAARKMTKDGVGRMSCLAGIGGGVSGIMASTKAADKILTIDGCPLNCAKKTLEKAGFSKFRHLLLADIGLAKGESRVDDANVSKVAEAGAGLLA